MKNRLQSHADFRRSSRHPAYRFWSIRGPARGSFTRMKVPATGCLSRANPKQRGRVGARKTLTLTCIPRGIDLNKMVSHKTTIRFSGHETFVCRYAWLPKAIREITKNPALFKKDDEAMVALGVGKNMVHSIKFWAESAQIIEQEKPLIYHVTTFGQQLLGHEGHDPFLEDARTLWLLHWKIATNPNPIFFWQQLLNFWHRAEFSESEILPFFEKIAGGANSRSQSTLEQGYRVFVNSYVATRGRKGEVAEDNLDSPLVELDLVRRIGDRRAAESEVRESIYAFNLDDKPGVTPELFAYCLHDFWAAQPNQNKTMPFNMITAGAGSPGQIFKLPEFVVRRHLDLLKQVTAGTYSFEESATIQQAMRKKEPKAEALLDAVYAVQD